MVESDGTRHQRSNSLGGICVVTFRSRETNQNATLELLDILSQLTVVSLVTAGLRSDADIRDRFEVVDISNEGTGFGPLSMAVRFFRNQFITCREIRGREEGIILFFGATAYCIPVLYARAIGKTVVVEPRGDVPLTLQLRWEERLPTSVVTVLVGGVRALERLTFRAASAIITYSPSMAAQLDLEPFEYKLYTSGARHVATERFRPHRPYSDRELRVGYVGRLAVEKGIPTLAAVAERLPPEIGFVFVGDGEYRQQLETDLADQIRDGQVELTGWVDHDVVPRHLNRMKLLVMPSEPTEGLPSTILESFACGTPVYATPVSGIPDVVRDGDTGFLMRERNPDAIAERIERILDSEHLDAISRNARTLIEEEYSFEATVTRYREMFEDID